MDEVGTFLEHYREQLLGRLTRLETRTARALGDNAGPRQFVDDVIDAWSKLPHRVRLSPVKPGERTFWYALYAMEDLTAFPADVDVLDPFEGIVLRELAQARRLLESRAELPDGKFAARPEADSVERRS